MIQSQDKSLFSHDSYMHYLIATRIESQSRLIGAMIMQYIKCILKYLEELCAFCLVKLYDIDYLIHKFILNIHMKRFVCHPQR